MSNLKIKFYNNLGNLCKSKYIRLEDEQLINSYVKEIGLPLYLRKDKALVVPGIVLLPKTPLLKIQFSSNLIQIENETNFSLFVANSTKQNKTFNLRFFSNSSDVEDNIAINIYKINSRLLLKILFWVLRISFIAVAFFVLLNTWENYFSLSLNININNWFSIPVTFILGLFIFSNRVYRFFQTLKLFQKKSSEILIESIVDNKLSIKTLNNKRDLSSLARLIQKQKNEILNNLFISQIDNSLSYDYLFPELYIKSPISTRKQYRKDVETFDDYFAQNIEANKNILLLGNAGFGKTINAIKIYLDNADLFLENSSPPIPVFLHVNSLDLSCSTSDKILEQIFVKYNIDTDIIKNKLVTIDDFLFIVDALDEVKNKHEIEVVKNLRKSVLFTQCWNFCTSRLDFFEKHLNFSDFTQSYYDIISLTEWEFASQGSSLISKIFVKQERTDEIEDFKGFISDNDLEQVLDSPLILTMLVFIWFNNQNIELKANKSVLYELFFASWIKRELKRNNIDEKYYPEILTYYQIISWEVLINPQISSNAILKKIMQQNSSSSIKDYVSNIDSFNLFKSDSNAFTHESFKEWLISKLIIDMLIENSIKLKDLLSVETTLAITTFVRIALQILPNDKLDTISNILKTVYYDNLEYNDSDTIYLRKNACYFLSRINTKLATDYIVAILNDIESNKINETPFVIGTILSGFVTIKGHYDIEQRYLSKLNNDSELDIRNRKYHLSYYGDNVVKSLQDFEKDNIKTSDDWQKTRKVLISRIISKNLRNQHLRTLDLITIRRFLETRKKTILSFNEVIAILKVDRKYMDLEKEKVKIIRREWYKLFVVTLKHIIRNIWNR
ncbi:MAG: hypothetical protein IEMM0006_1635 [bacterium]|nr:MAG: hypothetical protein IEMM0006_1635 [bacterium]